MRPAPGEDGEHVTFCRICTAVCGLVATVQDARQRIGTERVGLEQAAGRLGDADNARPRAAGGKNDIGAGALIASSAGLRI